MASWTSVFTGVYFAALVPAGPMLHSAVSSLKSLPRRCQSVIRSMAGIWGSDQPAPRAGGNGLTGRGKFPKHAWSHGPLNSLVCNMHLSWDLSHCSEAVPPQWQSAREQPPQKALLRHIISEKKNMGDAERKKSILCQKSWLVVLVQPIEGGCTRCIRPEISSCINFPASLAYLVILQELMSPLEEGLTSCQADTQQCYHPITKSLTVSSNNLYLCRPAPPAHMPHLTKQ